MLCRPLAASSIGAGGDNQLRNEELVEKRDMLTTQREDSVHQLYDEEQCRNLMLFADFQVPKPASKNQAGQLQLEHLNFKTG